MARPDRRKSKAKKSNHSQRMNHLKAIALNKFAQQAWGFNERYKTISLLTEALRRDPANPEIILNLAMACGKQRDYERAEELLSRLLELAPRKASIVRRVAQTYAMIDRPEQAVTCYRRSLELNRDISATVPTLLDLAGLYERRHQLDEAHAVVAEAITREPGNDEAKLQQAILDRRRHDAARAETGLRELVANESGLWTIRAQAGYELAQLLDDTERYDESFQVLLAAKRRISPHASAPRQEILETLRKNEELLQSLNKSHYERWHAFAENDAAYRFAALTSHPRSGTTLVEQLLDSHDELKSADEFDVFSQWVHRPIVRKFHYNVPLLEILDKVPPAVRQQARATYWRQTEAIFDEPIGDRMLLDKNPGMMILLPMVDWAVPGNEVTDRAPRSARRGAELLHAKSPADADQLQLAHACRRGGILCPRNEDLARRSPTEAWGLARIPV